MQHYHRNIVLFPHMWKVFTMMLPQSTISCHPQRTWKLWIGFSKLRKPSSCLTSWWWTEKQLVWTYCCQMGCELVTSFFWKNSAMRYHFSGKVLFRQCLLHNIHTFSFLTPWISTSSPSSSSTHMEIWQTDISAIPRAHNKGRIWRKHWLVGH